MFDQNGGGCPRPAAAEVFGCLEIAPVTALNMWANAGEERGDRLQVVEAPKRCLQSTEPLRKSFGVDLRRQDPEQGFTRISQFLRCNARVMPIIERSMPGLGPLFKQPRVERPNAWDCAILSHTLDEQPIDGPVGFEPVSAFDPTVELDDQPRKLRRR